MSLTAGTVNTRYVLADVLVHGFSTFSLDDLQPFPSEGLCTHLPARILLCPGTKTRGKKQKVKRRSGSHHGHSNPSIWSPRIILANHFQSSSPDSLSHSMRWSLSFRRGVGMIARLEKLSVTPTPLSIGKAILACGTFQPM